MASTSTLISLRAPKQAIAQSPTLVTAPPSPLAPCPKGTLPDNGVCIPVPTDHDDEGQALEAEHNAHRTRSGQITEYDQIPRHPERPADYRAYRYPVEPLAGQSLLMSGYDLHLPDSSQRRGNKLKAVGHGGIDLAQRRGAEVHLVALEHQAEPTELLFSGWLFGNSVVTLHTLNEAGQRREYIVIYGHLDHAAHGLTAGDILDEGALVGYVGDSDSPGAIHLHLEIRQVRQGVEARSLSPGEYVDNARSVACDPRNLLPLLSGM
jgi:murein DD-endopeptidase MepM/ murein hydrolase activator NlpD